MGTNLTPLNRKAICFTPMTRGLWIPGAQAVLFTYNLLPLEWFYFNPFSFLYALVRLLISSAFAIRNIISPSKTRKIPVPIGEPQPKISIQSIITSCYSTWLFSCMVNAVGNIIISESPVRSISPIDGLPTQDNFEPPLRLSSGRLKVWPGCCLINQNRYYSQWCWPEKVLLWPNFKNTKSNSALRIMIGTLTSGKTINRLQRLDIVLQKYRFCYQKH